MNILIGAVMANTSLYFELGAMTLLSIMGTVLLLSGLPGWGLVSTAILLGILSFGLRIDFNGDRLKPLPLVVEAKEK